MSHKDRTAICEIISEMLDHPNEHGIYSTSTAYTKLELYVIQERMQAVGWAYAYCCNALDKEEDPRFLEAPALISQMHVDLELYKMQKKDNQCK